MTDKKQTKDQANKQTEAKKPVKVTDEELDVVTGGITEELFGNIKKRT